MERKNTLYYYRKNESILGQRQIPAWMNEVNWRAVGQDIDKNCIVPSRSLTEIRKELGIEESNDKIQTRTVHEDPIPMKKYSFNLDLLDDERVMKAYIDSCIVPSRGLTEIRKELGIEESKEKKLIR